jgi:hypothetical protein
MLQCLVFLVGFEFLGREPTDRVDVEIVNISSWGWENTLPLSALVLKLIKRFFQIVSLAN